MTKAIRLTISGFLKGQFVQNVMAINWVPISAQTDFASAFFAATSFVTDLSDYYLACLPVDYIGSSVRAQVFSTTLYPNSGNVCTVQAGYNTLPGQRTGTLAVTSIGPILVFPFEVASKPYSGKMFLPGVTEADVDNNRLSSGLLSALQSLGDALVNPITDGDGNVWQYNIYSPKNSEIYPPVGQYVSTEVGSLRQRQRPHG